MRFTFASLCLGLSFLGIYLIGAGLFAERPSGEDIVEALFRPLSSGKGLAATFLAACVALGFFALAMVSAVRSSQPSTYTKKELFRRSSLFSAISGVLFFLASFALCAKGYSEKWVGLFFLVAAIQGLMALTLSCVYVYIESRLEKEILPAFLIGAFETILVPVILLVGAF